MDIKDLDFKELLSNQEETVVKGASLSVDFTIATTSSLLASSIFLPNAIGVGPLPGPGPGPIGMPGSVTNLI